MSDILSMDGVEERYGIPKTSLRYWRHRGEGPKGFRLGRRVVYKVADVEAWVAEQYRAENGAA